MGKNEASPNPSIATSIGIVAATVGAIGAIGAYWLAGDSLGYVVASIVLAGALLAAWGAIASHMEGVRSRRAEKADKMGRDAAIASADARAREADMKAEGAEAKLAPRTLTSDQLVALSQQLSSFTGERLLVVTVTGHETRSLARALRSAVAAAGWGAGLVESNASASGIWIELGPSASDRTERAANALRDTIASAGLQAQVEGKEAPEIPGGRVLIVGKIEERPRFPEVLVGRSKVVLGVVRGEVLYEGESHRVTSDITHLLASARAVLP
jgi:hypothetical protein